MLGLDPSSTKYGEGACILRCIARHVFNNPQQLTPIVRYQLLIHMSQQVHDVVPGPGGNNFPPGHYHRDKRRVLSRFLAHLKTQYLSGDQYRQLMANLTTYATHPEVVADTQLYNIQSRITLLIAGDPYPIPPGANTSNVLPGISQRALFHVTIQQSLIIQSTHHPLLIVHPFFSARTDYPKNDLLLGENMGHGLLYCSKEIAVVVSRSCRLLLCALSNVVVAHASYFLQDTRRHVLQASVVLLTTILIFLPSSNRVDHSSQIRKIFC